MANKLPKMAIGMALHSPYFRGYTVHKYRIEYASGMECGCFSDALELLSSLEMLWEFIWNAFRMRFGCILDALGMRLE